MPRACSRRQLSLTHVAQHSVAVSCRAQKTCSNTPWRARALTGSTPLASISYGTSAMPRCVTRAACNLVRWASTPPRSAALPCTAAMCPRPMGPPTARRRGHRRAWRGWAGARGASRRVRCTIGTAAPTAAPTEAPTAAPTTAPTAAPPASPQLFTGRRPRTRTGVRRSSSPACPHLHRRRPPASHPTRRHRGRCQPKASGITSFLPLRTRHRRERDDECRAHRAHSCRRRANVRMARPRLQWPPSSQDQCVPCYSRPCM